MKNEYINIKGAPLIFVFPGPSFKITEEEASFLVRLYNIGYSHISKGIVSGNIMAKIDDNHAFDYFPETKHILKSLTPGKQLCLTSVFNLIEIS